jgi:hypothetical protein
MEAPRGRNDLVAFLYVVGGIPAMVAFFVVFFLLVKHCGLPG